jgi:hypothetical protein
MSNIFLKSNFETFLEPLSESQSSIPQKITLVDYNNTTENLFYQTQAGGGDYNINKLYSPTSTAGNMSMRYNKYSTTSSTNQQSILKGGKANEYSITSSIGVPLGKDYSQTSSFIKPLNNTDNNENDVSKLLSMLTSDSSEFNLEKSDNLEQQLRGLIKPEMMKGGNSSSNPNVNDIKQFFYELKSKGVDVDVKLNNKTMSEFFALARETTTDINMPNDFFLEGGAKEKKKRERKSSGVINPGFQAFLDLKKFIAKKLNISNGPKAAKVAGTVQRDMKEKHPNITNAVEIAEKGQKHFEQNIEHYKQLI